MISAGVGVDPIWPAAGGKIFYKDQAGQIAVVSYTVKGDSFVSDPPRLWTPHPMTSYAGVVFDMTPDREQAIAVVDADSAAPETQVRVMLNFGDEIRRRLAGGPR